MKTLVALLMTILLVTGLTACASHEIRPMTPQSTSAYQLRQAIGGVEIAVDPITTKAKAEAAFTIDLTEQGYAPILLVMENRSSDSVLVLKDEIELVDSRGNLHRPVTADVMVEKFEHNKIRYALLGLGIFPYTSAEEANKKMRADWSSKELPAEKALLPNRKFHGVVYFDLGPGLSAFPNSTLTIPLQKLKSGEKFPVTFRIP